MCQNPVLQGFATGQAAMMGENGGDEGLHQIANILQFLHKKGLYTFFRYHKPSHTLR